MEIELLATLLDTAIEDSELEELARGITKPPGILLTEGVETESALALSLSLLVSLIVITVKVKTAITIPKPIKTN